MDIRKQIKELVEKAIEKIYGFDFDVQVLRPKEKNHGDFAVSVALEIGKKVNNNPFDVALKIKEEIKSDLFDKIEVIKPGFINFFLSEKIIKEEIKNVLIEKDKFFNLEIGKEKKIQIEFVSANPTGPLTVGNGRGGPFGDVLGNVLKKAGYKVEKAYYVNDFGKQILLLGHSILKDSEAKYTGEYIDELNKIIKEKNPYIIGKKGAEIILNEMIKKHEKLGIKYDEWFLESKLYEKEKWTR
jgi:arginyl-tRNA synthetase